jgi:TolB-like protein/Tfp pilus assembly protein PilF
MKRCPECRRDYYDDTLSFCLEDGSPLVYGTSEAGPATAILDEFGVPPSGGFAESATRSFNHTTATEAEPPTVWDGSTERQSLSAHRAAQPQESGVYRAARLQEEAKSRPGLDKRLLIAPLVLAVVILGGFFGYRYFAPGGSKQIESIAVMPFANESGNPDVDYLSDGMTETLISSLSNLPNLNVKPRSSVFRYKGKDTNAQTIGKELNVQAVLNGRVVQRGQDVSLFVELIDVSLDKVIWSESYNRKQSELVTLQSDVARDVSNRLKTKLSGAEEAKVTKSYTTDPEAYQLYLKGNYYKEKYNEESYKKAIKFYEKAIEKDPNYALAYVGMGFTYNTASNWYLPSREAGPKTQAAGLRAIELDDSIADAYDLLGIYEVWYGLDWAACEKNFKRAIELGSPSAHGGYGFYLLATGKIDEAVSELNLNKTLNPLNLNANTNAAMGYACARRYDEAIEQARRTIELDPNHWGGYQILGLALAQKRQFPEAITALEKAHSLDSNPDITGYLGYVYAMSGDAASAHRIIDELKRPAKNPFVPSGSIAFIYAGLNDKDKAFEFLTRRCERIIPARSSTSILHSKACAETHVTRNCEDA